MAARLGWLALDEIAAELGIKMTTARTQLAAIFAKTDTRRQAKLVAILTRLALVSNNMSCSGPVTKPIRWSASRILLGDGTAEFERAA
jgi:hypothetical protein